MLSAGAVGAAGARVFWTPKALNLGFWFDGSVSTSVTSDSNGVSQWNDLSGNGYNATQSTTANKPQYSSSRMSFAGDDWMSSNASISSITVCSAAVVKYTSSTGEVIFGSQSGTGGRDIGRQEGTSARLYIASGIINYIGLSTLTLANNVEAVAVFNTTASTWRISRSGTASSGTHSLALTAGRLLRLAATNGTSYRMTGTIAEVLQTTTSLSVADQQRLEGYLSHKWGLTGSLPSDHPYKTVRP
jgi:hypothetical protein